jgi:hypothetical protein
MRMFLVIGLIFAPLAALMAFLITYEEYSHHYSRRRPALLHGLRAALFAFVIFLVVALTVGWVIRWL